MLKSCFPYLEQLKIISPNYVFSIYENFNRTLSYRENFRKYSHQNTNGVLYNIKIHDKMSREVNFKEP